jgi:hypothetical protein
LSLEPSSISVTEFNEAFKIASYRTIFTMGAVYSIINHTATFYQGFFHYLIGQGRTGPYLLGTDASFLPTFKNDSSLTKLFKQHARIHLYTLAANFYLYNKPHYRKGSYRDDLVDNLRNVAVPGTGLPLSLVASSRSIGLLYFLVTYPNICIIASLHYWIKSGCKSSLSQEYQTRLLAPDDWFTYWRLNCIVVGMHAVLNDMPVDYEMENKWSFLEKGARLGVPVSPFLDVPAIVVKHRNEEGGMGIHFYKNATEGGDWIIQNVIQNSDWVSTLLPKNSPLSTFRIITCSRASIDMDAAPLASDVTALSCVFRAGREGALTDHDSILFDVDVKTGLILGGTTNAHWYRLGLLQVLPGRW